MKGFIEASVLSAECVRALEASHQEQVVSAKEVAQLRDEIQAESNKRWGYIGKPPVMLTKHLITLFGKEVAREKILQHIAPRA